MTFRKIDEDCVNGDQPFDSFVLKRVRDNINEAFVERPRRVSQTFASDVLPVLHGYPETNYMILGVFPISNPSVISQIKGDLLIEVQDDDVVLTPVLLDDTGLIIDLNESSSVTVSPGDTKASIEWNLRSQSSYVILAVQAESSPYAASKQDETFTLGSSTFLTNLDGYFDFGAGSGLSLDFNKRYILTFDSSSVLPDRIFEKEFLVGDHRSNRYIKVFPPIDNSNIRNFIENTTFTASITTIGSVILKGYCLKEFYSATDDLPISETITAYEPSYPPDFFQINNLYAKQFEFYKNVTPIFHFGGTNDRNQDDVHSRNVCPNGEVVFCADSDWRDVGACMLPANRYEDSLDINGTEYDRTKLIISGIAVCSLRGEGVNFIDEMEGRIRANLTTFGTDWDVDEVNLPISAGSVTGGVLSVPIRGEATPYIADAIPASGTAGAALTFHTMRGLFRTQLNNVYYNAGRQYVTFFLEIEDDEVLYNRMLRLQFKGAEFTKGGIRILNGRGLFIYVPSFTVWVAEGAK